MIFQSVPTRLFRSVLQISWLSSKLQGSIMITQGVFITGTVVYIKSIYYATESSRASVQYFW